jgi:hypothetical protein
MLKLNLLHRSRIIVAVAGLWWGYVINWFRRQRLKHAAISSSVERSVARLYFNILQQHL